MLDAIIISDLHLGAANCQAKLLSHFLKEISEGSLKTKKLILNGDVFDSIDFRRLSKHHWKVLSLLRKLAADLQVFWITGNHDGSAEFLSHLLGIFVLEDFKFESGKELILVLHGHQFDQFIDAHPWLTWWGDLGYWLLQKFDRSHKLARLAKKNSKTFLRCEGQVREKALQRAVEEGCSVVCCGHVHLPWSFHGDKASYFNSGSWTELPCTYLTVHEGTISLQEYQNKCKRSGSGLRVR